MTSAEINNVGDFFWCDICLATYGNYPMMIDHFKKLHHNQVKNLITGYATFINSDVFRRMLRTSNLLKDLIHPVP